MARNCLHQSIKSVVNKTDLVKGTDIYLIIYIQRLIPTKWNPESEFFQQHISSC